MKTQQDKVTADKARIIADELAKDAYIYAYSMEEAYRFFYETAVKTDYPLNQFQNLRHLADDTYAAHPSINNDTLHLMGWLDVAAEPVIVSVPDMDKGRYWILHTMDMGHYTDSMFGSRIRGIKGGQFMYASPSWKGEVPASVDEVVRVDSDIVKLMGRIMATGPEDEKIAQGFMDQWNIRTLSQYVGEKGPAAKVRNYPNAETASWLEIVNFVFCEGNLAKADEKWLPKYKEMGLAPCETDFSVEQLEAAKVGKDLGMKHIKELAPQVRDSRRLLGTRESLGDGARDWFSEGTYLGQWGLPPVEAAYVVTDLDSEGKPLSGKGGQAYEMKFKAPDVSEFWSLTVYASDNKLMAHNKMNRHSRGDRSLKADAKGFYTIKLSPDVEANQKDANFLPIPEKGFYVIMRLYGAGEEIQSGKYPIPDLKPVK
jgi:hypothetical protein